MVPAKINLQDVICRCLIDYQLSAME